MPPLASWLSILVSKIYSTISALILLATGIDCTLIGIDGRDAAGKTTNDTVPDDSDELVREAMPASWC